MNITVEQAKKLLEVDFKNALVKLKEGKTLSVSERRMLQNVAEDSPSDSPAIARNQTELAQIIGVSRKTIQRAAKRPGAPKPKPNGSLDVQAWREFVKRENPTCEDDDLALKTLKEKARNLILKNDKLAAQIEIIRGHWRPIDEVKLSGKELASAVRKIVSRIHLAAPNVVGVSVAEAEARLRELEDEIMIQLHAIENPPEDPVLPDLDEAEEE